MFHDIPIYDNLYRKNRSYLGHFSIFPNNYEILPLFSIQALLIFFLVLGWKHIRGFLKLADEVG